MSSGSKLGDPSLSHQTKGQVAKQMSQAALRLKAMTQLRQLLRSSPVRGALVYDFLLVLKYLPVGLMNKVSQFTEFRSSSSSASPPSGSGPPPEGPDSSSSSPSPNPNDKQSEKSSSPNSPRSVPVTPLGTPVKNYQNLHAHALPIPTAASIAESKPTRIRSSVLRNMVEMNSQNNRVIDQKRKGDIFATEEHLSPSEEEAVEHIEPLKTEGQRGETQGTFLETNLYWQNIEARTKYLVGVVAKTVNSKHNLIQHLDELFSHIYQHHETRTTAIGAGLVKILGKVLKVNEDTYVQNRSREILALVGSNPPTKGQGIKILAIDGGGVRGLVALEVLRAMENITGKKVYQLFDYVCGVSTGSILAFLLGAHKKSLEEAELLYKELSREIFAQNSFLGNAAMLWNHSYYHTPTFEKILQKHCGEVPLITLARDPELPRVSAISTVVNQERVCPYVFRTYALPPEVRARYLGGCRYHMWEAVRASAAAPTYFEEIKLGNYLHQDGGVLCNNPSSVAISEAKTIWRNVPLQCVVSLGTGLTLSSRTDKNINDLIETGKEGLSYLSWKGKFLKVLDSATDTESVHNTLNELLPNDIYFRFNPYLSEVVRLDEASPDKLARVQLETRAYLERNCEKVQFACNTLLKEKGISKKVVDWWYHPT